MASTLSPLHVDPASQLSYRLRECGQSVAPRSLLLLLHGVGGNENNLAALACAAPAGTLVALARGPIELGAQQYAWFRVSFTADGPRIVPSEAEYSRLALTRLLASLQRQYRIAPAASVIAGFSQGGILSASVALGAPEQVAGFGLLSGRILPELEPHLATPERLSKLRAFIGHGRYDSKLPLSWAERASQWLDRLGVEHSRGIYPTDHELSPSMQADFLGWLVALGQAQSSSDHA